MAKSKRSVYKVNIKTNMKQKNINVDFHPALEDCSLEDTQMLLNTLLQGIQVGLQKILYVAPPLRPPTEQEREAKIYVYVDEEEDNALYKKRKMLYDSLNGVFTEVLRTSFPDIQYIEQCRNYQQELIFDMSSEEAAEYNEEIKAVSDEVRDLLKSDKEEDTA